VDNRQHEYLKRINTLINSILLLMLVAFIFVFYLLLPASPAKKEILAENNIAVPVKKAVSDYYTFPDINALPNDENKKLIEFGRELIVNTAEYLGPRGKLYSASNGMNCQNCHLEAGTKIFGNNYSAVAAHYPKFRARSGTIETIEKRVNDCFERSLNGKALAEDSEEMKAIKSYILFLGSNTKKDEKVKGAGFKDLAFLPRAASPKNGKTLYNQKCANCHGSKGEGQIKPEGLGYTYPPLWGENSYNQAAGLFRITFFARFIKYNMPLGASHEFEMLSDEEAWDIAAFVNAQPRPKFNITKDWPDISKKPIDHPFGPYADNFSEEQHKFGPFQPIADFYKNKKL
jgi:thiosulfate dehydrogenase